MIDKDFYYALDWLTMDEMVLMGYAMIRAKRIIAGSAFFLRENEDDEGYGCTLVKDLSRKDPGTMEEFLQFYKENPDMGILCVGRYSGETVKLLIYPQDAFVDKDKRIIALSAETEISDSLAAWLIVELLQTIMGLTGEELEVLKNFEEGSYTV